MSDRRMNIIIASIAGLLAIVAIFGKKAVMFVTDRMNGDRWNKLTPETQNRTIDLLNRAEAAGLDVMFFEGWRSVEQEQADIAAGTSHLSNPYDTYHLWGIAVDIVFVNAAGFPSWPDASDPRWNTLANCGIAAGFVHPISWDKPHFQLPVSLASIRKKYGEDYASYLADKGVQLA